MKMSKTRLNTYLQCPRKFYYDYIEDLRFDKVIVPGSPLEIGLDVHEIFEWYYLQPESNLDPNRPYGEQMYEILERHPKAHKYPLQIENFVKFNSRMIKSEGRKRYRPKYVELDLYDKNKDFHGLIDVVFDTKDGIVVLDYKTGKKAHPISNYMVELVLYKQLFESTKKNPVAYCGIYNPTVDNLKMAKVIPPGMDPIPGIPCITLEDEIAVSAVLDETKAFCETHVKIRDYPPEPQFLCNYCEYKNLCKKEDLSFY